MSIQKVEMTVERIENGQYVEQVVYPFVEYDHVAMENGMDIMSMIRDDVSTPMVTHNTTSWKVGQGDSDVSETIVDSSVASMTIKGQTYQNILPNPSLRNSMTIGKTMQKLNEGYDSVNTVDGVCKSAILTGQTLVNIADVSTMATYNGATILDGTIILDRSKHDSLVQITSANKLIQSGKKYIAILNEINGNTQGVTLKVQHASYVERVDFVNNRAIFIADTCGTINRWVFVESTLLGSDAGTTSFKWSIIEYQEGMENWDIPYFEGMQSVKMPVLTTYTNLFPGFITKGYIGSDGKHYGIDGDLNYLSDFIEITNNKLSFRAFSSRGVALNVFGEFAFYDENKTFIGYKYGPADEVVEAPINTKYIRVWAVDRSNPTDNVKGMLIYSDEKPSNIATYEPYKTNILTVNEDVELRGIGDVKDELNLLTGEVTESVSEVVLDGTNTPNIMFLEPNRAEGYTVFPMQISDVFPNMTVNYNIYTQLISNNFNYLVGGYLNRLAGKWMCINAMYFVLSISNDELESLDIQGLNKWLSLNKTTIYYPSEKSIKTVDLTILDQDNQPVAQLNSFANGYIQVSSQEGTLIPTAEYEVPTSNSYHVDLMKANTQYTMKNMQGAFTIDGIQYNASVNGTFTSPSTLSNRLMITNVVQTQPMLLEGDMTSKEVPYVEGIKSAFEGADKVEIVSQNADNTLSNTTSFQLSNPLRSLPNRVQDEIVLDRVNHKARIIQRVGEDLTQLATPIVTEVNLEGYPYVYKGGYIFLNTEIAPITEMTYSINQAHQIESSNEDILRHQKEINHLYELIAQYVQVQYEAELIDIALQG